MTALHEDLIRAICVKITKENTDNTEEDLNMFISENVIAKRFDERFKENIQILNVKKDEFKAEPNGAWVYSVDSGSWVFERYDSVGEAVKRAIHLINALVICDGKEIAYDAFDDSSAYYINNNSEAIMIEL